VLKHEIFIWEKPAAVDGLAARAVASDDVSSNGVLIVEYFVERSVLVVQISA